MAQFLEAMGFGVLNDILSAFHSNEGYAQPNRYEIQIFPPTQQNISSIFTGQARQDTREVSLRCESILLPGRNLNTVTEDNIYGPTREIVDGVSYADEVTMTFQSSSELKERKFFEKWQNQAIDTTTWNIGYYNDYIGEVDIYLLDKMNTRRYGLKLKEAFPKTINPIDLSYSTNNTIIGTQIGMTFRYWEPLDIQDQPPSIGERIFDTVINTVERNIDRNDPKVLNKLF